MNKKVSTLVAALMAAGALVLPKDVFAQVQYANGLNYKNANSVTSITSQSEKYFLVFQAENAQGQMVDYVAVVNSKGNLTAKPFTSANLNKDFITTAPSTSPSSGWVSLKTGNYSLAIERDEYDAVGLDFSNPGKIKMYCGSTSVKLDGTKFSEVTGATSYDFDAKFISLSDLQWQRTTNYVESNILSTSKGYVLTYGPDKVLDGNSDGTASLATYSADDKSQVWYVVIDEVDKIAKFKNAETGKLLLVEGKDAYVEAAIQKEGNNWIVSDANALDCSGIVAGVDIANDKLGLGHIYLDGLTASEVNDINRGASFSLDYKFSDNKPATENPFNKNMKAFYVKGNPYVFYLATEWPSEYNGETDCVVEDAADLFKDSFTFVVATPNNHWNIQKFDGFGESAKFAEVSGSRLISGISLEDLKAGKHPVENAQFGMKKSVLSTEYILCMNELVGLNPSNAITCSYGFNIALVDDQKGRIVTTIYNDWGEVTDKIKFGAAISNTRTVKPSAFLSTDKASVFNIKFVSKKIANDPTKSEYNKYLTINESGILAHGSDFANLNAPENQWIVVGVSNNVYTFQNRENDGIKFSAELLSTDKSNVYELVSDNTLQQYAYVTEGEYAIYSSSEKMSGMTVELTAVTPDAEAGYATSELDNAGLVRLMVSRVLESSTSISDFYVKVKDEVKAPTTLVADKEESNAVQFSIEKFDAASTSTALSDSIYADNDYIILKEAGKDATKTVEDGDSIAVVSYAFKQLRQDGKSYYLNHSFALSDFTNDEADAPRFIVKLYKNGSYGLIPVTSDYFRPNIKNAIYVSVANNGGLNNTAGTENAYYNYEDRAFDLDILKETPGTSFNHIPQHVTMEAVNGGYVAMDAENKDGIIAPVSTLKAEYTKEDLTFWLDTTDSEAVTPSFMISKAGNYMYNATDSLNYYNDGTASADKAKEFGIQIDGNTDLNAKVIFQSADLTKVKDIENYKYQIIQSPESADEYVIKSLNGYTYVGAHAQKLYITGNVDAALRLTITPAEAPTSNEGVSATEVKVVAQNGSVVVKNAAGKNVVVSTILGQVVANEVLTSDNATINVPAGIVVVAVEGESFKVNVK